MSIYKKIPAIMSEVGHIGKNRRNTQGSGYNFRGIDDLYQAMQPLFAKHGVFCAPNVLREIREERQSKAGGNLIYTVLTVEFSFFADDGTCFKACTVGEAMDSGDKSANKAMSAALKYALLQVFCIPTEEDNDTENHSPEVAPKVQGLKAPSPLQAVPSDPGAYVIAFGKKLLGKRLDACDVYELADFSQWISEQTGMSQKGLETRERIEAFLKTREVKGATK